MGGCSSKNEDAVYSLQYRSSTNPDMETGIYRNPLSMSGLTSG